MANKKWFNIGLIITFLSPLAGIVLAVAFLTEENFKKEGKIILLIAFFWLITTIFLIFWLVDKGYLPQYQYLA